MSRSTRFSKHFQSTLKSWTVPIALLILSTISYGLLAPSLGLYQDDRYQAWFLKAFGPRVFIPFFAHERPLFGYSLVLTSALLGYSPLGWHIFAILTRWISAAALWWTLRQVWPKRLEAVTWISFLFVVYPGFQQHYVAMIYGHFYLYLAALLVSFGLSVRALRFPQKAVPYTIAGLVSAFFGLVPIEFYFGMELIRPLLFWFSIPEEVSGWKKRLKRVLKAWLPYILLWIGFLFWRVFIFKFQTYGPELVQRLIHNPILAALNLFKTILLDSVEAAILVWEKTWQPFTKPEELSPIVWASLGLAVLVSVVTYAYLRRLHDENEADDQNWHREAFWIGGLSLLFVGIPFWIVGLNVKLDMPYDRVTLAFMFSASLIWVGLVEWLTPKRLQKIVLVSVFVGLAAGFQLRLANSYRLIYEEQKSRFAQLIWRIPGLEPHTMILSNPSNSFMDGDNSATAILNWLYDRDPLYPELDYVWLNIPDRIGITLPSLEPGEAILKPFRSLLFQGSTDQAVGIYSSQPNCLRVLDPEIDTQFKEYPPDIERAIPRSNLEQVHLEPDPEVQKAYEELFGPLEEEGWCYYFQKADLMGQMNNWTEAARLADLAIGLPEDSQGAKELLVFSEAYARTEQWNKAFILSRRAFKEKPMLASMICGIWERVNPDLATVPAKEQTLLELKNELGCETP